MSKDLSKDIKGIAPKIVEDLIGQKPQYALVLKTIETYLPAIRAATDNFNKTQSQFMDNMLTVAHPTPLRNAHQILAQIKQLEEALRENLIKCAKKEVKIEIKKRDLEEESDDLKQKLIQLDMVKLKSELEITQGYIGGAYRAMANYAEQYNAILASQGKEFFTEEDFEKEEERNHIMKAFDQGLTAARSHNGLIDEGNMIYLTQIGINGAAAQYHVTGYLKAEQELLNNGQEPSHEAYLNFLNLMADRYKDCSKVFALKKGMTGELSKTATLTHKKE